MYELILNGNVVETATNPEDASKLYKIWREFAIQKYDSFELYIETVIN